jgi:predicted membrane channel-forming protein YqfA (hemolysin III family)
MAQPIQPSSRTLVGIAAILLLIGVWAVLVAAMARFVGRWPILVQAPFYLIMGLIWIVPLKPLVRWMQTGHSRDGPAGPR